MRTRVGNTVVVVVVVVVIFLICSSSSVGGIRGTLMGSRPPRCQRRCGGSCQQCEAIQVPTTGARKNNNKRGYGIINKPSSSSSSRSAPAARTTSGRADDDNYSSNYKPMSWKCKCGNLIFDP